MAKRTSYIKTWLNWENIAINSNHDTNGKQILQLLYKMAKVQKNKANIVKFDKLW